MPLWTEVDRVSSQKGIDRRADADAAPKGIVGRRKGCGGPGGTALGIVWMGVAYEVGRVEGPLPVPQGLGWEGGCRMRISTLWRVAEAEAGEDGAPGVVAGASAQFELRGGSQDSEGGSRAIETESCFWEVK